MNLEEIIRTVERAVLHYRLATIIQLPRVNLKTPQAQERALRLLSNQRDTWIALEKRSLAQAEPRVAQAIARARRVSEKALATVTWRVMEEGEYDVLG